MNTVRLLQILVLCFGIKELWSALKHYKQQKKGWTIASLCIGVFACVCAIVSMTGIL